LNQRNRLVFFLIIGVSLVMALLIMKRHLWISWVGISPKDHQQKTTAVVLVNSASTSFLDYQHFIQPYLDHFGIPFTLLDIESEGIGKYIGDYALIIIGHRQLDASGKYLDRTEEKNISRAVREGTGLVNFDNDLPIDTDQPYNELIEDVFNFEVLPAQTASAVEFLDLSGKMRFQVNCWEDSHQQIILDTTTEMINLDENDGSWTEILDSSIRAYPTILAGEGEENLGLRVMRCFAGNIPNGEYKIFANLYTGAADREMRYYYGFNADEPKARFVDTGGGIGGRDLHEEFKLGTVIIDNGGFEIYFADADLISGEDPYFGWSWIRLVPKQQSPSEMHWITNRHESGEVISTGPMTLAGFNASDDTTVLAVSGTHPFLSVAEHGQGRAVQWGSYDWMSHEVKGPLFGLDDLIWRSLVWAARKPFVMQGLPPFLTMRVDDVSGPFDWIHTANEYDIKPWTGLFFKDINKTEAADLSELVRSGNATTSIHAFDDEFFYYNHEVGNWSDEKQANNFREGTQWHKDNDILISEVVFPHFYEIGTNAFLGLSDWGVEFVGLHMEPGHGYGSPWIMNGPFRKFESGISSSSTPLYYADYITIPGHPEYNNEFFNCVTEI